MDASPREATYWWWLDGLRALAAVFVCAGHLRAALFVDYSEVLHPSFLTRAFYLLTGVGHQAVIVFFVMSGFLVGGSVLRAANFCAKSYAISRLVRLWIVLIPALALTLVFDILLGVMQPGIASGELKSLWGSAPVGQEYSRTFATFLGNVLFLQGFAVPVFGTNGPLWSLAYEFWFYVAFPLLVLVVRAALLDGGRLRAMVGGFCLLFLFAVLPASFAAGFAIWLLGAAAWLGWRRLDRIRCNPYMAVLALFMFCCAVLFSKVRPDTSIGGVGDLLVGLTFATLLFCLLANRWRPQSAGICIFLAGRLSAISYSLYAVHFPVVLLLGVLAGTDQNQMSPGAASYIIYLGGLILLCGVGWAMWWLTERHTDSLRVWVQSRVRRANSSNLAGQNA